MDAMKTGALILASFDQQEPGRDNESFVPFLPMVPLEGSTVIKREVSSFRKAGLSPIFVLGGYLSGALKTHLSHHGVIFLQDPGWQANDPARSLSWALSQVLEQCDRVISVPVERPLFSAGTLAALSGRTENTRAVFKGAGALRLHLRGAGSAQERILETDDEGLRYSLMEEGGREEILRFAKRERDGNALSAHIKLVLRREEDFFGPGMLRLLTQIEQTGSLQAAANAMGMSYSKAWKMLGKTEKQLGFPVVTRLNGGRNGGSSRLTKEGRAFMQRYQAMCRDMEKVADSFFDTYFGDFCTMDSEQDG